MPAVPTTGGRGAYDVELVAVVLEVEDRQRRSSATKYTAMIMGSCRASTARRTADRRLCRPGTSRSTRTKADDEEAQRGVDRRAALGRHVAEPLGQQAFAPRVEHDARLRVHGGDQQPTVEVIAREVGEEGAPNRRAPSGDRDERDRRGGQLGDVLAEGLDRGVGEEHEAARMSAMLANRARGMLLRGLSVSSASAPELSQPMNRYTASGKPRPSPLKPLSR